MSSDETTGRTPSQSPDPASMSSSEDDGKLNKHRWLAVSMVGLSFLAALAISWKSKEASIPEFSKEPDAPTTQGLAGFPKQVTVLDNLELARRSTPRKELTGISVLRGLPGGVVDVENGGVITYTFRSLKGEGPQAERPYGTLARQLYCGQQAVRITKDGIGATQDHPKTTCRGNMESLPTPTCSLKQLWALLDEQGIKADSARFEYFRANAGPAWRVLPEGGEPLAVAADCKTELKGEAANYPSND